MVYAGSDPRFILRRLSILANEDVGLADPNAIVVVNACAQAARSRRDARGTLPPNPSDTLYRSVTRSSTIAFIQVTA